MTSMKSQLRINGLELCVHLGWPADERLAEQVVLLDIDIVYAKPPTACLTDQLDDTNCYAKLTNAIRLHLADKRIHLIEHLAQEIFSVLKTEISVAANMMVHITKHPKIRGLTKGVTFSYGE